ncbi:MucBP domain-containing protein [Listeria welshimeri]|uniref:MucBP domain-containing protein n=1 Tax=Listeria welshimeri TaxID=1643 RepID=UPI0018892725|nr:MucBP domain-containing protein [Listeria welshimeri]MBF2468987.1 MucBP domain-containing protein [Listeria welshimeri]
MNKKLGLFLFAVLLTFGGFLLGNSPVYAAESDTSNITYKYVDFDTLTKEQKNNIIKGNPTETLNNDYENYSFVYKKNTAGDSANTDNNSAGGSKDKGYLVNENSPSGNASNNGKALIKTGDVGPDIYLIMLGFVLVGSGIGLLTLKKRHAKQFLLFLILFGGGSLMIGSIAQAAETSNLKPQETTTVAKGTKETKKPGNIEGYTYVGYIHTSKNNTKPTPLPNPVPMEQGSVTVNYQDEQGNSLAPTETLKGDVGKTYTTVQKDITGYDFKEVQGNATGEFTTKAQVVTYIYAQTPTPVEQGTVTVNYQDGQGNAVAPTETLKGDIGETYTTVQKDVEGYDFKEVQGDATGEFTTKAQVVNYIYAKTVTPVEQGTITVNYQDEQGNSLAPRETLKGDVGETYTTVQKDITGYDFKEVQGNTTGEFTTKAQVVNYIYTKTVTPVEQGTITVNYQDEQGNSLAPTETLKGDVGETYTTVQKDITGYDFKEVQGDATGEFTTKAQVVNYIYTKTVTPVEQGTVTVNYQDEQGNSLAPTETLKGDVGETYTTAQKDITGYDFKEVQGNATGEFTKEAQVVNYIYTQTPVPAANLTIKYLDENGNQIHEPKIISGNVGDPYDVTGDLDELQIEGYTIDTTKLPANATGVLSNDQIQVIYIYNKKTLADVTITVKFVDQDGNPFMVPDLTTYQNGDFVPFYSNLDQYKVQLDYNQQIYNQNQVVPDIVIPGKEGDAYSLPKEMNFNIMDDKGNIIEYIIAPDTDDTARGIMNFYNITSIPENREGTLKDKDIVVTYKIIPTEIYRSAP